MYGALLKSYYAEKEGIDPSKIYVVSVMPCIAKKFERQRDEMKNEGLYDVDNVITITVTISYSITNIVFASYTTNIRSIIFTLGKISPENIFRCTLYSLFCQNLCIKSWDQDIRGNHKGVSHKILIADDVLEGFM